MNIIFIFVILMLIETILKSIGDKRKIQKNRMDRRRSITKIEKIEPVIDYEFDKAYNNEKVEEKVQKVEYESINVTKSRNEDYVSDSKTVDNTSELDKSNDIKITKQKKRINNDFLRGVIFSEILSEPKAVQNMRKSI